MTYAETIDYLFNQLPVFQVIGPGAYKPGLDTAHTLSAAFDHPHHVFHTIHVAGTNGKGSTSHMLASILMETGKRVGLFTSPHIFDFRERIRVNGEKITEEAVTDFVERYQAMNLNVAPSFFELTTMMAFEYFRSQHVDFAIIEVGLGGRLDTTNIIRPLLSVITNISPDHKSLLGNTLAEIASEKAGIIKPGIPVIIGEAQTESEAPDVPSVRQVFEQTAKRVGAPIIFAQDHPFGHIMVGGHYVFAIHHGEVPSAICDLTGEFQAHNINTVITAVHALNALCGSHPLVTDDDLRRGLASVVQNTHLMGRWTCISTSPVVICDTGHNIGAWEYLGPKLSKIAANGTLRAVIGFVNDKDVNPIFALLPKDAVYYFVTPSLKRGRPASELLELATEYGLKGKAYDTVAAGYGMALADSEPSDVIFVGGSNFVVADLPIQTE